MPTTALISADEIVYGASYPILVDSQVVGSYTVSEEAGNPSVILFTFDPAFQPEPGQIITLFTIPSGQEALWERIELQGQSSECLVAHGQVSPYQMYQMSFEEDGCGDNAPHLAATFLLTQIN
jgi:hypothetical protein